MSSKEKWLEKAYECFAEVGPLDLNIKALSVKAGLPRTNFYYHFIDKDDLIKQVLNLHYLSGDKYNAILKKQLKNFLPDLHLIGLQYIVGIKFHRQLFLHRNNPKFGLIYLEMNKSSHPVIIPKLIEHYKLNVPYEIVESLWITLCDTWYSRLDINQFSLDYLCDLTENIIKTVLDFTNSRLFVNSIQPK